MGDSNFIYYLFTCRHLIDFKKCYFATKDISYPVYLCFSNLALPGTDYIVIQQYKLSCSYLGKVFITPDLTIKEREENKIFRKRLAEINIGRMSQISNIRQISDKCRQIVPRKNKSSWKY